VPQESYKMPVSALGFCLWAPAHGLEWSPAVVTRVNRDTVSLIYFAIDARMGVPRDGVRFVHDPSVAMISPDEGGIWDFTLLEKQFRELMGITDDFAGTSKRKKAEVA